MQLWLKNKKHFLILLVVTATIYSQEPAITSSDQLDFWVGEWEVTWDEGEGKMGYGVNRITKVLDGKVIQENFEITEGQSKGYKGTSISSYHTAAKKWFQCYADNNGTFYHFVGNLNGDRKTFKTDVFTTKDGKDFTQRMVFHHITQDAMIWDWESSNDGGKTWTLNWKINYKRKG